MLLLVNEGTQEQQGQATRSPNLLSPAHSYWVHQQIDGFNRSSSTFKYTSAAS